MSDAPGAPGSSRSITFVDALALLFIAFKLAHVGDVATWSWWWVLAPLWMWFLSAAVTRVILRRVAARRLQQHRRKAFR